MNSHSDVESSAPHPDSSDSSAEAPDSRSAPLRQSDAEDTTMGPDTTGAPEVESTLVEEPHAVAADAVTVADPDLTVDMRLEGLLDGFAQSLPPEQQDLDQTLPQTSLKPVADVRSDQSLRLESFSQSGSVRPRSIQSASEAGVTSRNVTSPDVEAPAGNMDYVTLDKLGQGGMGTVHLARQVALGREVALKQIHQRSSHRQAVRDEFLSEAILTGKLEHPNIVPVYEVGESPDGELFYAMKNVKGRAWDSTIDDLLLSDNLKILIDVCDAIAFAHAEGVIHRDLKPQNIMTGGFGEVLVLDWGLAVSAHPGEDVTASAGGTPSYMAPEMITPPFLVGPRSDVYLLSAILFRFLTGKAPHAGKSARSSLEAVSKNEIITPDAERMQALDPTGELLSVAMKAMATDPEDRYQTVGEFQQAVREFEAHQESLTLAARAEEALESAEQSGDYTEYSEAVFGFGQAVELWTGNATAAEGIERSRQSYALCAEQ
ncbi:MAG: serine/threonine-protein kinase, partial [Planctomycetaceae bacterium]